MFKKIRAYFAGKSIKQRVFIVFALLLFAVFMFFFIKGNIFDRKKIYPDNSTSIVQSEMSGEDSEVQVYDVKFHISFVDVGVLVIIIVLFVIHKIRERKRHRR